MGVLPKPSQLKKEKKASAADHSKSRIAELAKEENKLVKNLNTLRDDLARFREEDEQERMQITEAHKAFVSSLKEEVASLEARKAEALAPIVDRTPEFEALERKLTERWNEVKEVKSQTDRKHQEAKDLFAVAVSKDTTALKHLENAKRLQASLEAERAETRRLKSAFDEEQKRWVKESSNQAYKLKAREGDIVRAELSLEAREAAYQKLGKELHDRKRAVEDGYANLLIAQKYVEKKKK